MSGDDGPSIAAEASALALGEPMDIMTALQLVLKKSLAHDGLACGLHEGAKVTEKHSAQLCVLAEDCNQPDYVKLVKAFCADHNSPEAEAFGQSDAAVCDLVNFLDSIGNNALSDPDNESSKQSALEVLAEIQCFVSSPLLDQGLVDALSFELPKVVAKFAGLSDECCKVTESIVDHFISVCSPRDMLSILCEALDSLQSVLKKPSCFVPLLSGLSKVFPSIRRRHFEQMKEAAPAILNAIKAVSSEMDDEDKISLKDLFSRAISVASSIQVVCEKLVQRTKESLLALLGLYVLQVMALITSSSLADDVSGCIPFVSQLSQFLPFCGLSYLGLITGCDVEKISSVVIQEDSHNFMSCFSSVKHGATLAVIWGHISDDITKAATEDSTSVKDKLQRDLTKRWQALGMLRYVLSSIEQPWIFKSHSINFLLCITEESTSTVCDGDYGDFSSYVPSLFGSLQAIEWVIMHASDAVLRKKAFTALKRVLADIPPFKRFDLLKALVTNNNSPSMIAILIDLVKEEIRKENCQEADNKIYPSLPFWCSNALELVEFILKPPKGGPPSLPEQSEAVVSALNLYRFLLIKESTGKTNDSDVLSETNLRKVYTEWLLPLRTLVSGIEAENENDHSQFAIDTVCALNPVQLVLYRCIELVEENLKRF